MLVLKDLPLSWNLHNELLNNALQKLSILLEKTIVFDEIWTGK